MGRGLNSLLTYGGGGYALYKYTTLHFRVLEDEYAIRKFPLTGKTKEIGPGIYVRWPFIEDEPEIHKRTQGKEQSQ
ncbi:hypothetical protein PROFUN_10113 [Planoprotostelium fungivorum]|uniref:Uncharacterized protein n=1 Tax=Planoprotostelium fungivorum TaxID=1890364 RepID=A0A2P6NEM4_9EUKA|nr:hypothetical protein PROFUN_10113 [Planoprotostelium fungivorum]